MARLGAGVRKRADGTLEKRFTVDGHRYSVYAKTTKELAEKEQTLREQIKAGSYVYNRQITLDSFFKDWISEKAKTIKPNSQRLYKHMYDHNISEKLGKRKVYAIERREVVKLQNDLIADDVSVYQTNYSIMLLNMMFEDAIRDEIRTSNPAANIKPLKYDRKKATKTIHKALTQEEQAAFMKTIRGEYYYPLLALLLCTGLRFGEAGALLWSDIDYVNGVIHVNKTVSNDTKNKLIIGKPKSAASIRDIPMNKTIKNILKQAKENNKLVNGTNVIPINNRVFTDMHGGIIRNPSVAKTVNHAIEQMQEQGQDIDRFTIHCLRDTFATRFIEQGGNPQTLKALLGHSSIQMTMDLYAQVLPNIKSAEMDKLVIAI